MTPHPLDRGAHRPNEENPKSEGSNPVEQRWGESKRTPAAGGLTTMQEGD